VTAHVQDLWLRALSDYDLPPGDVRRWWNLKETQVLDTLLDRAPRLRLGTLLVTSEPQPAGPTRRVFQLLYLRGTLPDESEGEPYVLPLLNDRLKAELLAAFAPQQGDHPGMTAVSVEILSAFLDQHRGARLAPD
jgi:hypothetical protein